MTEGDMPRDRLAARMRNRRIALRMTKTDAASRTGVARNTWSDAEEGVRDVQTKMYAGIEAALRWEPGSVQRILAGGEPTELPGPVRVDTVQPRERVQIDLEHELALVERLDQPAAVKLELIKALIRLAGQAQQEVARDATPTTQ